MADDNKTHSAIALIAPKTVSVVSVPTIGPSRDEVLIKVQFGAFTAFDNHQVQDNIGVTSYPHPLGLAAVGRIVKVGEGVDELVIGDYVGAATFPPTAKGLQEYVSVDKYSVSKIPEGFQGEQIAAIMDNFTTAWWTIVDSFKLPLPASFPLTEAIEPTILAKPILIWGAGTTSGQFILQILKSAGYHNLIATASERSRQKALEFGATSVFYYSDPNVAEKIRGAAGGSVSYAVDAVSTTQSMREIAKTVGEGSVFTSLVPIKLGHEGSLTDGGLKLTFEIPNGLFQNGVETGITRTFTWQTNTDVRNKLFKKILPDMLEQGLLKPPGIILVDSGSLEQRGKDAATLIAKNLGGGDKIIIKIGD